MHYISKLWLGTCKNFMKSASTAIFVSYIVFNFWSTVEICTKQFLTTSVLRALKAHSHSCFWFHSRCAGACTKPKVKAKKLFCLWHPFQKCGEVAGFHVQGKLLLWINIFCCCVADCGDRGTPAIDLKFGCLSVECVVSQKIWMKLKWKGGEVTSKGRVCSWAATET